MQFSCCVEMSAPSFPCGNPIHQEPKEYDPGGRNIVSHASTSLDSVILVIADFLTALTGGTLDFLACSATIIENDE